MRQTDDVVTPPETAVRHFTVACRASVGLFILWMSIPMAVASLLAKVFLPSAFDHLFVVLGMVGGTLMGERIAACRARSALRSVEKNSCDSTADLLNRCLPVLSQYGPYGIMALSRIFERGNVVGVFASMLRRSYGPGQAYCISDSRTRLPGKLEPLPTPFDPIPLRDADPVLISLTEAEFGPGGRFAQNVSNWREACRVNGWPKFFIYGGLIFMMLIGCSLIYLTLRDLLAGRKPEAADALWPVLLLFLGGWIFRFLRPREWFALPGAVAVRTSSWKSSSWRLRLLQRENAVLLYWRDLGALVLVDDEDIYLRAATPRVAAIALKAWISPGQTPTLDRLSDLT